MLTAANGSSEARNIPNRKTINGKVRRKSVLMLVMNKMGGAK
jgi:hypothetical protein